MKSDQWQSSEWLTTTADNDNNEHKTEMEWDGIVNKLSDNPVTFLQ